MKEPTHSYPVLIQSKELVANLSKCFIPTDIYLFKVNNENIKTMCEISPNLTILTPERPLSGVCIVNFEQISYTVVSTVDPEQVNAGCNCTAQKVLKSFLQSLKKVKDLHADLHVNVLNQCRVKLRKF